MLIAIALIGLSCHSSGASPKAAHTDRTGNAIAAALKRAYHEDSDDQKLLKDIRDAAAARYQAVTAETERDVSNARQAAATVAEAARMFPDAEAAARGRVRAMEESVTRAADSQDPTKALLSEIPAKELMSAGNRLHALDPAQFVTGLAGLDRSPVSGATAHRAMPIFDFLTGLSELKLQLESYALLGNVPKPGVAQIALRLDCVLRSSWRFERMQTDAAVLAATIDSTPFVPEARRAALKSTLDRLVLSFNTGTMRQIVTSLEELRASIGDRTNAEAEGQGLAAAEARVMQEIASVDEDLSGSGIIAFSAAEQKQLGAALRAPTSKWGWDRVREESRLRTSANPCEYAGGDGTMAVVYAHACVINSVQELAAGFPKGPESAPQIHAELLTILTKVERAKAKMTRFESGLTADDLPDQPASLGGDAAGAFDSFRRAEESESSRLAESLAQIPAGSIALHRWFGQFLSETTSGYWERVQAVLQAAITLSEESGNLAVRISQLRRESDVLATEANDLRLAEERLKNQQQTLTRTEADINAIAAQAAKDAPDLSVQRAAVLTAFDLEPFRKSVASVGVLPSRSCAQAPEINQRIGQARQALDATPVDSESRVSIENIAKLAAALGAVSDDLLALTTTCFAKGRGKKQQVAAMNGFVQSLTKLQARIAGLAPEDEQTPAASNPETFEGQEVFGPLRAVGQSPSNVFATRSYSQAYRRASTWKDWNLALTIANEAVVIGTGGVAPLAYGLAGESPDSVRLIIYPEPFPVGPVVIDGPGANVKTEERAAARIPGPARLSLGVADAGILGIGTLRNLAAALRPARHPYELDATIFGKSLSATIAPAGPPKADGTVYISTPGDAVRLALQNVTLSPADFADKRLWRQAPPGPIEGVFAGDGEKFNIWKGRRRSLAARSGRLVWAGLSATGFVQILQGLPHGISNLSAGKTGGELVAPGESAAYRVLDGYYLAGIVVNGKRIFDAVRFKFVARHGGFVDAREPKWTPINLQAINQKQGGETAGSLATARELRLTHEGELFYLRPTSGPTYVCRLDETVVGRFRKRSAGLTLLSATGLSRPYQALIDSRQNVRMGLARLTQPYGSFVERQNDGGKPPELASENRIVVLAGNREQRYRIGEPFQFQVDGKRYTANAWFTEGDHPQLRGLIDSAALQGKQPGEPLGGKLWTYVPSLPEQIGRWNALIDEGRLLSPNPVFSEILRNEAETDIIRAAKNGTKSVGINGDISIRSGATAFTLRSQPDALDVLKTVNSGTPDHSRILIGTGGNGFEQAATSIVGLGKLSALASTDWQRVKISQETPSPPSDARALPLRQPADDAGESAASSPAGQIPGAKLYWDKSAEAWRTVVEETGKVFSQKGVFQYQTGRGSILKDAIGIRSPFEWLQEIPGPAVPDFDAELNPGDLKEVRLLQSGVTETRYYFSQTYPLRGAAFTGAFAVRTGPGKSEHAFRIDRSIPGAHYESENGGSGESMYWKPVTVLAPNASLAWVKAAAPSSVERHLRSVWTDEIQKIQAWYGQDQQNGQFLLRVSADLKGGSTEDFDFAAAPTHTGEEKMLAALLRNEDALRLLPEGLPQVLMTALAPGLNAPDSVVLTNRSWGQWEHSSSTLTAARDRLEIGGASILPAGVSENALRNNFQLQGKNWSCTGGDEAIVVYGGAKFLPCHVSPGLAALRFTDEKGDFTDPDTKLVVGLSRGQFVIVEAGRSLPAIRLAQKLTKARWPAPIRVFESAAALVSSRPAVSAQSAAVQLPSFLSAGSMPVAVKNIGPNLIQIASDNAKLNVGGTSIDAGRGTVWYLQEPQPAVAEFASFNKRFDKSWSISLEGWQTIADRYREDAEKLGQQNELQLDRRAAYSFTDLKGTKISGFLTRAAHPDPFAPVLLEVQRVENGSSLSDPLYGTVPIAPQDTLILRVSLPFLQSALAAPAAAVMFTQFSDGVRHDAMAPDLSSPEYAGISTAGSQEGKATLSFPYPAATVLMTGKTAIPGEVTFREPALRWLSAHLEGYGYVAMKPGRKIATGPALTTPSSGLVGIGDNPGEVPLQWVRNHQRSCPNVDRTFTTYIEEGDAFIGEVIFGRAAAEVRRQSEMAVAESLREEAKGEPPFVHEDALLYESRGEPLQGPGCTQIRTLVHRVSKALRRDTWAGERLVRREYLAAGSGQNQPFRTLYFRPLAGEQVVARAEGPSKTAIIERYEVIGRAGGRIVRTRDADGRLRAVSSYDREGPLLWTWKPLSQTLEIFSCSGLQSVAFRQCSARRLQGLSVVQMFRLSGETVPRDKTADLRTLVLTDSADFLGATYTDRLRGLDAPVYHIISRAGRDMIDEVYEAPRSAPERRLVNRRLPASGEWYASRWQGRFWQLQEAVRNLFPDGEERQYDEEGNFRNWKWKNWSTQNDYNGRGTDRLSYSELKFGARIVARVFYPPMTSLQTALGAGVADERFIASLPGPPTNDRADEVDVKSRYGSFARNRSIPETALKSLLEHFGEAGLPPDTVLQPSLVVSSAGGTSIVYRFPDDSLERPVLTDWGGSRALSTRWEGSFAVRSEQISADGQVSGTYNTAPIDANETVAQVLDKFEAAYYDYAARYLADAIGLCNSTDPLPVPCRAPATYLARTRQRLDRLIPSVFRSSLAARDHDATLRKDLEAAGISYDDVLRRIDFQPRGTLPGKAQQLFTLPTNPLGEFLIQRDDPSLPADQVTSNVNLWWVRDAWPRDSKADTAPAPDILPANLSLQKSVDGYFGSLRIFSGPAKLDNLKQPLKGIQRFGNSNTAIDELVMRQPVDGYWYQVKSSADYLVREFHLRESGRLYLQVYKQKQSFFWQMFPSFSSHRPARERWVYLDTTVPYYKPVVETDENGNVSAVWTGVSFAGGTMKQTVSTRTSTRVDETDQNGFPAVRRIQWPRVFAFVDYHSLENPHPVLLCLIYALLVSGFILLPMGISGRRSGRKWREFRQAPDSLLAGGRFGNVYTEIDLQDAITHVANCLLASAPPLQLGIVAAPRVQVWPTPVAKVVRLEGIPEIGFLSYLYPIYATIFARLRLDGRLPAMLSALDKYSHGLGIYLVTQYPGQDPRSCRFRENPAPAHNDSYAWEKLLAFLQFIFLTIRETDSPDKLVHDLKGFGINGQPFTSRLPQFKEFLERLSWEAPTGSGFLNVVRKIFGFTPGAIHIYAQEFIDLLPVGLATVIGVCLLFRNEPIGVPSLLPAVSTLSTLVLALSGWRLERSRASEAGGYIQNSRRCMTMAGMWLALAVVSLAFTFGRGDGTLGVWLFQLIIAGLACVEAWGYVGTRHSLIGMSIYHHFRPTIGLGRARAIAMVSLQKFLTVFLGTFLASLTYGWWYGHFTARGSMVLLQLAGGFLLFCLILYLIHFGLWSVISGVIAVAKEVISCFWRPWRSPVRCEPPLGENENGPSLAVVYAGPSLTDDPKSVPDLQKCFDELTLKGFITPAILLDLANYFQVPNCSSNTIQPFTREQLSALQERGAADRYQPAASRVADPPLNYALAVERLVSIMTAVMTMETRMTLLEIAHAVLQCEDLRERLRFIQVSNCFGASPGLSGLFTLDTAHDDCIASLFSREAGRADAHATVYSWTNRPTKSGNMNGILADNAVRNIGVLHVLDRNTTVFRMRDLVNDYRRILRSRGDRGNGAKSIVVMAADRNTSNTIDGIGRQNECLEGGHGSMLRVIPDKIGTGWHNLASVYFRETLQAQSHRSYPLMPLSPQAAALLGDMEARWFGLIGFSPNAVGQSEDLWSVFQEAHNAMGIGRVPDFNITSSVGVKARERRSTFAVNVAATRWAGGLIDALRSPINQQIGLFGPECIFERKARRNAERFYLSAPVGVLSIFLMVLAVLFDANPFVGTQVLFFLLGALFNQGLTLHGLAANVRSRGLISGCAKWFCTRVNDAVLFAPRYFMEAASVIRSLGGGHHGFILPTGKSDALNTPIGFRRLWQLRPFWVHRREDNGHWPWIALGAGAVIWVTACVAVLTVLDFGNVLLAGLSLVFVTGALIGFFTEDNRPGRELGAAGGAEMVVRIFGVIGGLCLSLPFHFLFRHRPLPLVWHGALIALALSASVSIGLSNRLSGTVAGQLTNGKWLAIWRAASVLTRTIVKVFALTWWFAVLPIPDGVRATRISTTTVVGIDWVFEWLAKIVVAASVIVLSGKIYEVYKRWVLWRRFRRRSASVPSPDNENALMEFLVRMGAGHWVDAEIALDQLQ